ncbi:MAG: ABC transporter ATP-binding protein [Planctomycetaceae bacterium]|nr:ABC transporter ATP-binding protein [Planctomycetaceae bacterium]
MRGYVELFRLGKTYDTPTGSAVIVENFDLNLQQGEYVCLLGHSGCGKSTVLTMVAGLNSITTGGVAIAGREISGPGPDRGIVFQSPCLMPWMTAFENVMLGVRQVYPHGTRQERRDIAAYYLTLVGLGDSLHKRAGELSQGMQQRVGIARAFALQPKMLLLDEPFGMLDSLTRMELQEVLLDILARDRITTLMITHDVDEALFLADRVVMMTNGPRARVGAIFQIPFSRPRGRAEVLDHPEYYEFREQMIHFLETQDHKRRALATGNLTTV